MRTRTTALVLVALAAVLAAGCGTPKAVPTYEFLTDYQRMTERFDPLVSKVWASEDRTLSDYDVLIVDEFRIGKRGIENRDKALRYALRFRYTLAEQIQERQLFDRVVTNPGYEPADAKRVCRIRGSVTRFNFGSGFLRFFASSGATDFQVECRIADTQTGQPVMELVDRRRHLGNTPFFPYYRTFDGDFVMKVTVKQTAVCLANFMKKAYDGLPPTPKEQQPARLTPEETSNE